MTDQWVRYFSVTDPRRHAKGFTVYKVTSTIFPRNKPEAKTELVVWKRFKEFQKLHKDLKNRHEKLFLKDTFPLFSKPRIFGRFESDVIEERQCAAQTLLDFAAKHSPLFTSQACVKFFEKSHKVLFNGEERDNSCQQSLNPPAPLSPSLSRECDVLESASQSSSPTDTDSTTSLISGTGGTDSPLHLTEFEAPKPGKSSMPDNIAPFFFSAQYCSQSVQEGESGNSQRDKPTANSHMSCPASVNHSEPVKFIPSCPGKESEAHGPIESTPMESISVFSPQSTSDQSSDTTSNTQDRRNESQTLTMDYITLAGYHISQAVEHEANSQFEAAFSSYKAAISCLLSGVQDDTSEDRKSLVQRKASQYLLRAEQIYHDHLDACHNTTRTIPEARYIPQIPDTVGIHGWKSLEAPLADLKIYKVLGVVSTVILALNTRNDSPYIVKVLHKSSCPISRRTKSIVPCNVPFMCRLFNFIENESAVFLILEQARGGRLLDYVSPYFEVYNSPKSSKKPFGEFLTAAEDKTSDQNSNCSLSVEQTEGRPQTDLSACPSQNVHSSDILNGSSREVFVVTPSGDAKTLLENYGCGGIPDVVIQEAPPSVHEASTVCGTTVPDILPSKQISIGSETCDILHNSQKLLESVNKTLCKSEEATKAVLEADILNSHLNESLQGKKITNNSNDRSHSPINTLLKRQSKDRLSIISRDRKRSVSRERKSSTSRHSRSRLRFSCDDMFEGRARALSRSLDREALQRADPRIDQVSCIGLPIETVRLWAAQLLMSLDALHRWGVVIGDLRPDNLLLGSNLDLVLTYQCQWVCVDHVVHQEAIEQLYAAPEIGSIQEKTVAADWWSYGAILFELLSGETLNSCHPGGFHSYSSLHVPNNVCEEGASLLQQLLRFEPQSRLGVGPHGVAKLKAQSFFRDIEWSKVLLMSASV